ncbi:MAG: hypothetical protein MMC33_006553 [Icmadophila ericetorum]|nr:hypothetical protein [Icmadophila ericetorum]
MADSGPEIIYGAAGVARVSTEELDEWLNILQKHNVKSLDTAYAYPNSEVTLGQIGAPKKFAIHTKAPGLSPGSMSKQKILEGMEKALKELQVDRVDLYYLHAPDTGTPIEETLSAIQELYAAGKFKRFGISNYLPADVQKIYDIQASAHSVLPTVFQGNYNAVSRHVEDDLFPLLHKLGISFYAYSPIAGGFLIKDSAQLRSKEVEGRFNGETWLKDMYTSLYGKESLYQAVDQWGVIAKDAGISKAALAYRWITYHSALSKEHGDGVIFGASKLSQLEETLAAIDVGPLDAETAKRASGIWEAIKKDAPRDNYHDYMLVHQVHQIPK